MLIRLPPPLCPRSTIVYKGMLRSAVVGEFYLDLADKDYETAFAIYHRRFSTNTTPKWPLAQPMRVLGHNGGGAAGARVVCGLERAHLERPKAMQHTLSPPPAFKPGAQTTHPNPPHHPPTHPIRPPTHPPTPGEINTLQGNLNWVASRQAELSHPIWAGRESDLLPLCDARCAPLFFSAAAAVAAAAGARTAPCKDRGNAADQAERRQPSGPP